MDKQTKIRQHRGETIKPPERLVRLFKEKLKSIETHRGLRRQWGWNVGAHHFTLHLARDEAPKSLIRVTFHLVGDPLITNVAIKGCAIFL